MVIDLGSMAALKSSLDSAVAILKAMVGLRDAAMIQDKVIELQGVILSAQSSALAAHSAQFALLEQVRELKEEMAKMKKWDAEKQKYELKAIGSSCFAYMLKPEARGAEPPHWLCTTCYEQGRRSILQYHGRTREGRNALFRCTACNATITTAWSATPTFS